VNGERYCDVLKNFVLPVGFLWDGSEILCIMQDGEPPHFALPVCLCLDSNFLAPFTGHRQSTEGHQCDLFCGIDSKRSLPIRTEHIRQIAKTNTSYVDSVPLDL
jgi:hypothetical protein